MWEDGWLFGGMGQNGVVFLVLQLRCEQGFLFYYLWILGKSKRIMIINLALLGVPEMALRVPESKL